MAESSTMRRADKQITERNELDRILTQARVGRLGMVDGGRPYVVPLNFAHEGDDVWVHCASSGRMLDCLRTNPQVCFEVDHLVGITTGPVACDDWTSHYESIIGFGVAEIVADASLKLRGLTAIMRKYSGRDDWQFSPDEVQKTAVLRLHLETLTGKRSPRRA